MKIQPINNPISMQMKQPSRKILNSQIIDKVELDNGSTFKSIKYYDFKGQLTDKLMVLRDKLGNWVKSRLKSYKGRQVLRSINSNRKEN